MITFNNHINVYYQVILCQDHITVMFEKEKVFEMKLMNLDQEHLGIQETEYEVVIKKSVGDLVGTKLPAAGNIIVSTEGDSGQYQDATCLPMPSRVGGHQNISIELMLH